MADKYVNRASMSVVTSAADTLTFSQLTTGISTFSKQAFVIHRVNWYAANRHLIAQDGAYFQAAITMSNKASGLSLDDPGVLHMQEWHVDYAGTPANVFHYIEPDVSDFSTLPGGGLIVPANPIFLAVDSVSIGSAITISCRFDFTVIDLKADEYIELVEALRMIE